MKQQVGRTWEGDFRELQGHLLRHQATKSPRPELAHRAYKMLACAPRAKYAPLSSTRAKNTSQESIQPCQPGARDAPARSRTELVRTCPHPCPGVPLVYQGLHRTLTRSLRYTLSLLGAVLAVLLLRPPATRSIPCTPAEAADKRTSPRRRWRLGKDRYCARESQRKAA